MAGGGGGTTEDGAAPMAEAAEAERVKPHPLQNLCPASVRAPPQLGQKPNPVVIPDHSSDLASPRHDEVSRVAHGNWHVTQPRL